MYSHCNTISCKQNTCLRRLCRHSCAMFRATPGRTSARPPAALAEVRLWRNIVSVSWRRHVCNCAVDGQHNGSDSSCSPREDSIEDPVEAMMRVAKEELGMHIAWSDPHDNEEDYLDAMEDLEGVWMRNLSPPEWAEVTGLLQDSDPSSTGAGNGSSPSVEQPGRAISTISWQELLQQLQDTQQQKVVIVEVLVPAGEQQQQPLRPLPDPRPWAQSGSSTSNSEAALQHHQLSLQDITRNVAAGWQDKAVVAVVDTGHHSCLAAAIRLSAVYKLPQVVLLQL